MQSHSGKLSLLSLEAGVIQVVLYWAWTQGFLSSVQAELLDDLAAALYLICLSLTLWEEKEFFDELCGTQLVGFLLQESADVWKQIEKIFLKGFLWENSVWVMSDLDIKTTDISHTF